ncbi:MAG: FliH/SctL family protein [Pseudomonadota bacterium]
MANSSDWIAQFGAQSQGKSRASVAPQSAGWLAALTLDEGGSPGGFREVSPFAAPAGVAASVPRSEPDPEPTGQGPLTAPVPGAKADEDPEALAFARGLAEGEAQARRAGEAALVDERERLRELRLTFRSLDAQALDALAQDLNATVLTLCKQVLGDYALDTEALEERCREAAKRLGTGPSQATLHLNPETLAALDKAAFADWTLAEDATLSQGSLRVTNADGTARDGLEDWMRALAEGTLTQGLGT